MASMRTRVSGRTLYGCAGFEGGRRGGKEVSQSFEREPDATKFTGAYEVCWRAAEVLR